MGQEVTLPQFRRWLLAYAQRIIEKEEYLTQLDTPIGDADHGANMRRGMQKVEDRLESSESDYEDVCSLFRSVAMTLISAVGGAAGPLYGTFFLRAATGSCGGQSEDLSGLARMFRDGLDGLRQRGKAQLSDKTMVDSIQPAVEALEAAVATGHSLNVALNSARQAARLGMKRTISLQARKGRASYLGPRSIGHQDPGATSAYYLFETAVEHLGNGEKEKEVSNPDTSAEVGSQEVRRRVGSSSSR